MVAIRKKDTDWIDLSSSDLDSEIRDPSFKTSSFLRRKRITNRNVPRTRNRTKNANVPRTGNRTNVSNVPRTRKRARSNSDNVPRKRSPRVRASASTNPKKEKVIVIPRKPRSYRQRPAIIRIQQVPQKDSITEWLINEKILRENEMVEYMDKSENRANKTGMITRNGIYCFCCSKYFGIGGFQVHGGGEMDSKNIFVMEKGVYMSCLIHSDLHDDACMICADGGDLMCCESCPSTYHHTCMGLEAIPEGTWYCPYCVCKFCEKPAPKEEYLVACPQCKMRYHNNSKCQEWKPVNIDLNKRFCGPFCTNNCNEVYDKIDVMIGTYIGVEGGYKWSLLKRFDEDNCCATMCVENPYKRLLCNSKIEVAWGIMKESFEPIIDRHTQIDILKSVVFNKHSVFNRIDFSNFYAAVLEMDNQIVSVACLRIHMNKIAEMPFIATREIYRGNGFCSKLLAQIESTLSWLKVEYLVIPSTRERVGSWNRRHKFGPINQNLKKLLMSCNTLMFHDSLRLQKILSCKNTGTASNEAETSNRRNLQIERIGFSFL